MGYSSPTRLALGFLQSGKTNRSAWDGLAQGTGSPGTSDRFSHHGEPQPCSLDLIFRELSLILDSGNPSMSSAARFHAEPSNYHVIWSRLDPFRDNSRSLLLGSKADDLCKNQSSVRCGLASGVFCSPKKHTPPKHWWYYVQ